MFPHMTELLIPPVPAEASTAIPAIPPGVRLSTLENGLTLIIREDHSAPVVSAQAWCKAGSVDEGRWLGAGLSHVLEHMLFKGTNTRAAGRIDQEVQHAAGSIKGSTTLTPPPTLNNFTTNAAANSSRTLSSLTPSRSTPP